MSFIMHKNYNKAVAGNDMINNSHAKKSLKTTKTVFGRGGVQREGAAMEKVLSLQVCCLV